MYARQALGSGSGHEQLSLRFWDKDLARDLGETPWLHPLVNQNARRISLAEPVEILVHSCSQVIALPPCLRHSSYLRAAIGPLIRVRKWHLQGILGGPRQVCTVLPVLVCKAMLILEKSECAVARFYAKFYLPSHIPEKFGDTSFAPLGGQSLHAMQFLTFPVHVPS